MTMPRDRLTPLDASFLRIETANAHMHVGWKGTFAPRPDGTTVSIAALRRSVGARLCHADRFRKRLAFPPAGLGEPVWVDDEHFAIERHVVAIGGEVTPLPRERFDAAADACLSRPLERDRPLWRIELAPLLEGGGLGLVMKVHHAMVDGRSAVELALLLLDLSPDAAPPEPADRWAPRPAPGAARLAVDALADRGAESLRAVRGAARMAARPAHSARIADTLRRAALAVGEDVLRPAPSSYVNVDIGPRRTLVHHTAAISTLLHARDELSTPTDGGRATLNDVALTVVAGAMRELSMSAGRVPQPLKVMVPVSTRTPEEAVALGNRIAFVFVELPVHLHRPVDRLAAIHAATSRFKRERRATGGAALLSALGALPEPLKDRAARLAASPRMYNLTISNVQGPREPVYLLGCELREAVPVIPLPERHALSIGVFTYRDRVTFSGYADPAALPGVRDLPSALNAAMLEMDVLRMRNARRRSHAAA